MPQVDSGLPVGVNDKELGVTSRKYLMDNKTVEAITSKIDKSTLSILGIKVPVNSLITDRIEYKSMPQLEDAATDDSIEEIRDLTSSLTNSLIEYYDIHGEAFVGPKGYAGPKGVRIS